MRTSPGAYLTDPAIILTIHYGEVSDLMLHCPPLTELSQRPARLSSDCSCPSTVTGSGKERRRPSQEKPYLQQGDQTSLQIKTNFPPADLSVSTWCRTWTLPVSWTLTMWCSGDSSWTTTSPTLLFLGGTLQAVMFSKLLSFNLLHNLLQTLQRQQQWHSVLSGRRIRTNQ